MKKKRKKDSVTVDRLIARGASARIGTLICVLTCALTGASAAAADNTMLATNEQALQHWAQASGAPAPAVQQTADGGSQLIWRAGVSYDFYNRNVSGGQVLTPFSNGTFNRMQLQSDLRSTQGETLNWFQFGATASDDRSALSMGKVINTLQAGRTGPGYRIALGDVPVNHSALGTSLGLRGILGQNYFGQTLVSGAAGVVAESWEALNTDARRRTMLRDVYSLKIEHPLSQTTGVYATAQSYSDQRGSLPPGAFAVAGADATSSTVGFTHRSGAFFVNGEGGASQLKQDGQSRKNDTAFVVDGGWQGKSVGLRTGHHDLGQNYSSASGQALGGIRETYGNATWMAQSWLTFSADARTSLVNRPPPPPQPVVTATGIIPGAPASTGAPAPAPAIAAGTTTDSGTLSANITIPQLPGTSAQLSYGESAGRNPTAGNSNTKTTGANLQYGGQLWNAGIGMQVNSLTLEAAPAGNSDTTSTTFTLGRRWSDAAAGSAPTWQVGLNFAASEQRQEFDIGTSSASRNFTLSLSAQSAGLGLLNASWLTGRIGDPVSGAKYTMNTYQIDAGRPAFKTGSIKLYARYVDNFKENPLLAYREQTVGVQFVYNH